MTPTGRTTTNPFTLTSGGGLQSHRPPFLSRDTDSPSSPRLLPPISQMTEEQKKQYMKTGKVQKGKLTKMMRVKLALGRMRNVATRHLSFIGPGIIASVAYFDPGNYATDLQAGAQYGYSHLFVVLLSGLFAILLQIMACRLGIVSGMDLAAHCRRSLHDRKRFKYFFRWGVLYPLYFLCECAVIFTDLAELLGTAIALNLLIPGLPLYAGVLLTSTDVFLILMFFDRYPGPHATRGMHIFELFIGCLVLAVLVIFVILLVRVEPDWGDTFRGYIPSSGIINNGALYVAVGIIGATVMPHAIFLGSKLATIDRLGSDHWDETQTLPYTQNETTIEGRDGEAGDETDVDFSKTADPSAARSSSSDDLKAISDPRRITTLGKTSPAFPSSPSRSATLSPGQGRRRNNPRGGPSLHLPQPVALPVTLPFPTSPRMDASSSSEKQSEVPTPSLSFIKSHITHASVDIAFSLACFALVINSAILILSSAAFYYGNGQDGGTVGDLFGAFDLIKARVGEGSAILFAIALLCSGQSASITVTLSGQVISEGFINWRTTPWVRRIITRLIGIIPSLAIAIAVGRNGIDTLLVASQVALSIVLPFVIFPLVLFTSQEKIMLVKQETGLVRNETEDRTPRPDRVGNADEEMMTMGDGVQARESIRRPTTTTTTNDNEDIETTILPPPALSDPESEPTEPSQTQPSQTEPRAKSLWSTIKPYLRLTRARAPTGYVTFVNPPVVSAMGWMIWLVVIIANVYALYQLGQGDV